jgi:hypothetical protein
MYKIKGRYGSVCESHSRCMIFRCFFPPNYLRAMKCPLCSRVVSSESIFPHYKQENITFWEQVRTDIEFYTDALWNAVFKKVCH